MTVTIIVVLELILCAGWISQSNAQHRFSLFPQEHQIVCRGQNIFYTCIGNGTDMRFFSPPIVNESQPLTAVNNAPTQTCNVMPNPPTTTLCVASSGGTSFMATFALFISDEQSEGQRSVHCDVVAGLMLTTASATFSVLGAPNRETVNNIKVLPEMVPLNYSDDGAQAAVNISWDSPVNAQEFSLTISNTTGYVSVLRSLENRVTVLLPYGTYSANLCVINRCGTECQDSFTQVSVERQISGQPILEGASVDMNPALLASAIIAGVLGVLLILFVIYGVVITIKLCKMK